MLSACPKDVTVLPGHEADDRVLAKCVKWCLLPNIISWLSNLLSLLFLSHSPEHATSEQYFACIISYPATGEYLVMCRPPADDWFFFRVTPAKPIWLNREIFGFFHQKWLGGQLHKHWLEIVFLLIFEEKILSHFKKLCVFRIWNTIFVASWKCPVFFSMHKDTWNCIQVPNTFLKQPSWNGIHFLEFHNCSNC